MTLIDSSALASFRASRNWVYVKNNMNHVRPFPPIGNLSPHELPGALKAEGHSVGVVTSSPKWYAQSLLKQFKIPYDVLVAYEDTTNHKPLPDPILTALKALRTTDFSTVFYVGDDQVDVEAAAAALVTSIGVSWGQLSAYALSSTAPDILLKDPNLLVTVKDPFRLAYLGERFVAGKVTRLHTGSLLVCDSNPTVYALGRYFVTQDARHATSILTDRIISLKTKDVHADDLGQLLALAIKHLPWTPDYIVPVPKKPSQQRDRFAEVIKAASKKYGMPISPKMEGLICEKEISNYKSMSPSRRAIEIVDAFSTGYNWDKTKVLLLDDVYTSGSTIKECTRILKADKAGEVRCLVFGKSQTAFQRKMCRVCGRPMRTRTNKSNVKFWGCSGWPNDCQHTESL